MKLVTIMIALAFAMGIHPDSFPQKQRDTSASAENETVQITFSGIKSSKGVISGGVFIDQLSFESETPFKAIRFSKDGLQDGRLIGKIELKPGIYGISVLDDENRNKEMDYNFIGLPKEGFGFSNYYLSGFSKPHFDKFKFEVVAGKTVSINIKLRYI